MFNFVPSIDRYIFKLVVVPMLGVFALAASLLTLDKMLRLFDFVAVEGGPVGVVFKMLGALIPEYASLAIPLGLMLGILVAFRKLATSSELDVLRAVGMSYGRMLRMPYRDEHGNPVFIDIRRWIPAGDVFDVGQGHGVSNCPSLRSSAR